MGKSLKLILIGFLVFFILIFYSFFVTRSCSDRALQYSVSEGPIGLKGTSDGYEKQSIRKMMYDSYFDQCTRSRGAIFFR